MNAVMTTRMLRTLLVVAVATFLNVAACIANSTAVASVCSLVDNENEFVGRIVSVSAKLRHNGMDVSVLIDNSCPGKGVRLHWTTDPDKLLRLKPLRDALVNTGSLGTVDKEISATFIGHFTLLPKGYDPRGALILEDVARLQVVLDPSQPGGN